MPKLSVIMPCLNVVNYIDECIESVVNQTLKDIEIIIIDAKSTDGTLEVIRKYAENDNRIIVLQSSIRSYGHQVNMGLEIASGECISIVDTDDILDIYAYEKLYHRLKTENLDYIKGYARAFWDMDNGQRGYWDICNFYIGTEIEDKVIEPYRMPQLIVEDHFLWQGIYTRNLLRDIRLNETSGAAYQDQGFCLQVFLEAKRAAYINWCVYYYRQDNMFSSTYNRKGFNYTFNEFSLNLNYIASSDSEWKRYFYARLFLQCIGRFNVMAISGQYWEDVEPDILELRRFLLDGLRDCEIDSILQPEQKKELLLLKEEPGMLFQYMVNKYAAMRKDLKQLLAAIHGKRIVIVSCGIWGRFLNLLVSGYSEVLNFCDNNSKLWGTKVDGKSVKSVDTCVEYSEDVCFIIANKKYQDDIKQQLLCLGIKSTRVFAYNGGVNLDLVREVI